MRRGSTNGILILAVKRGNEIVVEYSKKEIINKINSYFGYQLINEIKLQASNIENKKKKNDNKIENLPENYKNKINQIKNENIRNSLFELTNVMKK